MGLGRLRPDEEDQRCGKDEQPGRDAVDGPQPPRLGQLASDQRPGDGAQTEAGVDRRQRTGHAPRPAGGGDVARHRRHDEGRRPVQQQTGDEDRQGKRLEHQPAGGGADSSLARRLSSGVRSGAFVAPSGIMFQARAKPTTPIRPPSSPAARWVTKLLSSVGLVLGGGPLGRFGFDPSASGAPASTAGSGDAVPCVGRREPGDERGRSVEDQRAGQVERHHVVAVLDEQGFHFVGP